MDFQVMIIPACAFLTCVLQNNYQNSWKLKFLLFILGVLSSDWKVDISMPITMCNTFTFQESLFRTRVFLYQTFV